MEKIRIGNAAGFWGDSPSAPKNMLHSGNLDYLTLEYLAELTLSILAHQKSKRPDAGYVTDVPEVAREFASIKLQGASTRLITNGGGMNPDGCASHVSRVLADHELGNLKVGVCSGDDFIDRIGEIQAAGESLENMDTGESFDSIQDRLASANVYLGADGIQHALGLGADVVLTGRIADASLVTGPCIHEFGWTFDDLDQLANATVAGHLIECGAQVTGGFFSDWNPGISLGDIGYPIAEIDESGECIVTKPEGSGGEVSVQTCAEQLIYEIGDPARYVTPDVIADFSNVRFESVGENRVAACGGQSRGKPEKLKASIAYYDGFMASGTIVMVGPDAESKARIAGESIFEKLGRDGIEFEETCIEVIGAGDTLPGQKLSKGTPWEVVLRIAARSPHRANTDRLGRELAPLVTSGPPGVTGYTSAKARSVPVLAFWPALVSREHFKADVKVRAASEWITD